LKLDSQAISLLQAEWISNQKDWVLTLTGPEGVKRLLEAEFFVGL